MSGEEGTEKGKGLDQKEPMNALGLELGRRPEAWGLLKGEWGKEAKSGAKLPRGPQASLSGDKPLGFQGPNNGPLGSH